MPAVPSYPFEAALERCALPEASSLFCVSLAAPAAVVPHRVGHDVRVQAIDCLQFVCAEHERAKPLILPPMAWNRLARQALSTFTG